MLVAVAVAVYGGGQGSPRDISLTVGPPGIGPADVRTPIADNRTTMAGTALAQASVNAELPDWQRRPEAYGWPLTSEVEAGRTVFGWIGQRIIMVSVDRKDWHRTEVSYCPWPRLWTCCPGLGIVRFQARRGGGLPKPETLQTSRAWWIGNAGGEPCTGSEPLVFTPKPITGQPVYLECIGRDLLVAVVRRQLSEWDEPAEVPWFPWDKTVHQLALSALAKGATKPLENEKLTDAIYIVKRGQAPRLVAVVGGVRRVVSAGDGRHAVIIDTTSDTIGARALVLDARTGAIRVLARPVSAHLVAVRDGVAYLMLAYSVDQAGFAVIAARLASGAKRTLFVAEDKRSNILGGGLARSGLAIIVRTPRPHRSVSKDKAMVAAAGDCHSELLLVDLQANAKRLALVDDLAAAGHKPNAAVVPPPKHVPAEVLVAVPQRGRIGNPDWRPGYVYAVNTKWPRVQVLHELPELARIHVHGTRPGLWMKAHVRALLPLCEVPNGALVWWDPEAAACARWHSAPSVGRFVFRAQVGGRRYVFVGDRTVECGDVPTLRESPVHVAALVEAQPIPRRAKAR